MEGIKYNKFFQTNFSKAKILVDFFIHNKNIESYNMYIREGVTDLISNISGDKYASLGQSPYQIFINNIEKTMNDIDVNNEDFTKITLTILILISAVIFEQREKKAMIRQSVNNQFSCNTRSLGQGPY